MRWRGSRRRSRIGDRSGWPDRNRRWRDRFRPCSICDGAVVEGDAYWGLIGSPDRSRDGAVDLVLRAICDAAIEEGARVIWLEIDRLIVDGDRKVVVTLVRVRVAEAEEGQRIFGIQLDRSVVIGHGAVIVARPFVGIASTVEWRRNIGIKLDSLIVVGDGSVESPIAAYARPRAWDSTARSCPCRPRDAIAPVQAASQPRAPTQARLRSSPAAVPATSRS